MVPDYLRIASETRAEKRHTPSQLPNSPPTITCMFLMVCLLLLLLVLCPLIALLVSQPPPRPPVQVPAIITCSPILPSDTGLWRCDG